MNLLGLAAFAQLETFVARAVWGAKPFRARQLMKWIYRRGAADFSDHDRSGRQEFPCAARKRSRKITVPQIVTEQISSGWHPQVDAAHG